MRILQVNTADRGGGAEGSAYRLFEAFRHMGHHSMMAVGTKYRRDEDIFEIPRLCTGGVLSHGMHWMSELARTLDKRGLPAMRKAARVLSRLSNSERMGEYWNGLEENAFPGCSKLLDSLPAKPDIVHIHNMHGWYFDMETLPVLSNKIPTILNLRDTWALTGHCAYFMDCELWRNGCGACPGLDTYPGLRKDGTAANWRRKADIYSRSRLYVTAPSKWLLDCAGKSMLLAAEYKVIPNGIDTGVFCPGDREAARAEIGIPSGVPLVMFASAAARTVFKDQDTLRRAVMEISETDSQVHFLCVGAELESDIPNMHRFKYISSPALMAQCYRAADVFLHTAKAEAFGKTVTEAMASGTPVVATGVGGLLEQILPGETGFLAFSPREHAAMVMEYLSLPGESKRLMEAAAARRGAEYSLERQARAFLEWYEHVAEDWKRTVN